MHAHQAFLPPPHPTHPPSPSSPPLQGGPFRYCDLVGPKKVAEDMQRYADALGEHFAPPQLLLDVAKSGKTFH